MTVMIDTKQTDRLPVNHTVSVKGAIAFLQEAKLQLQAINSDGRFIYRIVDKDGSLVSVSSRLARAVITAVEKIHD